MGKILVFFLLWRFLGNPFLALLVLLVVLYLIDRRFIGLTPSLTKPFRRNRRLSQLRNELAANPHDSRSKVEAARLLIEKKKFAEAHGMLEQVLPIMEDSAEIRYELGLCKLMLGETAEGEKLIRDSLERNPRLKYGEPYLKLGEAFATSKPEQAVQDLQQFRSVQSSSCEAYFRIGVLYERLGRKQEAAEAFRETGNIYRSLPKYKRKSERRWALLAALKKRSV
ncbi:tetratricopeptide repeat protein [Paenibacillus koleovorans]|uniref:tetratricopeptide repeat protein n=1 Tax=Paenibacillus koleovorans TaxID=121608 RepID=UPI000FD74459|nr:tetratricopeptide repeat protein [Paenibacillus koleovorans]